MLRGLVADLGGTNARFAVAEVDGAGAVTLSHPVGLIARRYNTATDAVDAYLQQVDGGAFDFAAMACAGPVQVGPVQGGQVSLTNLGWTLSETHLRTALSIPSVHLLNDLAAVAWAAPVLREDDLRLMSANPGGARREGADVIAVLGAGTGTNCAAFLPHPSGDRVLAGEGGHVSFAPCDEREVQIWRSLAARYGRVSIERLASGPGMLNLYQALCEIAGQEPACDTPEAVSALADKGDALAGEALDRFAMILGSIAGDFTLSFGAGVLYVAGGLGPRLLTGKRAALFCARFDDKGRFAPYMQGIGVAVIVHPHAALIGAARAAFTLHRSAS